MNENLRIHNELCDAGDQAWQDYKESQTLDPYEVCFAFSKKSRRKIVERDGGKSVKSGRTDNLHAAHIDHSRSNPRYDDPSNGRTLTRTEHFNDHWDRLGQCGLPEGVDEIALNLLWNSMSDAEKEEIFNA